MSFVLEKFSAINSMGVAFVFSKSRRDFNFKVTKEIKTQSKMSKIIFVVSVAFFVTLLVSHGMISV